ncbi:polysaccharide deacetylase family protein [Tepidibacter thalassicus]|uniref:Peptidoglycan/xylan/chitin deacetylase, PgdA/CDA1 family n=1 Tax=Tepidibacter thalassicus DSM 15285 TaxID=1123350 RepID=A0A1M5QYZ0_9FIRM|nr:polysaccharide deacetylase family protein [Tepidibacter thalassicus]SHH19397.1 Peptidoglycan/xylan/chitin deacetylase, PgdA/CDA1 family [Tepidibacter thalassicus DSM 15285]
MNIILFVVFIVLVYAIIPNYYNKYVSCKVLRRMNTKDKKIALTFDDGPDERYTNRLLDLLKKYDVKATFFIVVYNMYGNEKIVERIIEEGHSIGIHSLKHKHPWLSSPFGTIKDFKESLKIFNELGIKTILFRPPWGMFNILTQFIVNILGLKTVLYSLSARDWSDKVSHDYIANKIINNVKCGDIILLHDSGGAKGAPDRTIKALENVIPELIEDGYDFVTVETIYQGDNTYEKEI